MKLFFLSMRRPPRSTPFPSATLFRSPSVDPQLAEGRRAVARHVLGELLDPVATQHAGQVRRTAACGGDDRAGQLVTEPPGDRKSTRLNSSHANISYAVFCLKKKKHLH